MCRSSVCAEITGPRFHRQTRTSALGVRAAGLRFVSTSLPGECRDPYAVSSPRDTMAETFCHDERRWLWGPGVRWSKLSYRHLFGQFGRQEVTSLQHRALGGICVVFEPMPE